MTELNTAGLAPVARDIDTIFPYEKNAKRHPADQVKRLAESIKRFGWRGNPIIVDKFGVIIAGHGRRLASIELGLKQVPVLVVEDMSAEEARAFRLVDNRAAESDIDANLLQEEVFDLGDLGLELLGGIFDDKELDFFNVDDLGGINESAFADDIDAVTTEQAATTAGQIEKVETSEVPVARALGFKSIGGGDVIWVTRFLASIEADTGLEGAAALVAFAKNHVGATA